MSKFETPESIAVTLALGDGVGEVIRGSVLLGTSSGDIAIHRS
jgi:hypothetical protein